VRAWLVAALIAAWQLPDDPFEIFDCRIVKLDGNPRWTPTLEGGGGLQLQPAVQNQAAPYSSVPPHTRFFSYHQAVTRVEAEEEDSALERATEKFRCLIGALGIVHSVPQGGPLFRIVSSAEIPTDAQPEQALPAIDQTRYLTAIGGIIVNPLAERPRQELLALDHLAREEASNRIFRLWAVAEEAHRFTFSPEDRQDALLAYSRVAERVADAATPDPRPDVSKEIKHVARALSDALTGELSKEEGRQSSKALAQSIKEAQDNIAELRYQTSGLRLKRAAEALKASADLSTEIYGVWKLRSEKAGHDCRRDAYRP